MIPKGNINAYSADATERASQQSMEEDEDESQRFQTVHRHTISVPSKNAYILTSATTLPANNPSIRYNNQVLTSSKKNKKSKM